MYVMMNSREIAKNGLSGKNVVGHLGNISRKEFWLQTNSSKDISFLPPFPLHEDSLCTEIKYMRKYE